MVDPCRGEIWTVNLNPTRGHEQAGQRPALVVSADQLNASAAGLIVVIPLTTKGRGIPLHVEMQPPDGGVQRTSFAMCENIRAVVKERLTKRWGMVSRDTMKEVEKRLYMLLEL